MFQMDITRLMELLSLELFLKQCNAAEAMWVTTKSSQSSTNLGSLIWLSDPLSKNGNACFTKKNIIYLVRVKAQWHPFFIFYFESIVLCLESNSQMLVILYDKHGSTSFILLYEITRTLGPWNFRASIWPYQESEILSSLDETAEELDWINN